MNCPYCGKEMQQGSIFSPNPLEWRRENDVVNRAEQETVQLTGLSFFGKDIESFYCPDCRMIVTPVPEIEEPFANVKSKLKGLKERAQQQRDTITADWNAQKEEKQKEKQRKKDPWEV